MEQLSEKDVQTLQSLGTSHESFKGLSTFERCAAMGAVEAFEPIKTLHYEVHERLRRKRALRRGGSTRVKRQLFGSPTIPLISPREPKLGITSTATNLGTQRSSPPGTPERCPPGTPEVRSPPGTPEGRSPPGTPESRSSPGTPERRSPPGTPEGRSPPGTPEGRSPPGTPEGRSSPGTPERRSPPGTPERRSPPGTPEGRSTAGIPLNPQPSTSHGITHHGVYEPPLMSSFDWSSSSSGSGSPPKAICSSLRKEVPGQEVPRAPWSSLSLVPYSSSSSNGSSGRPSERPISAHAPSPPEDMSPSATEFLEAEFLAERSNSSYAPSTPEDMSLSDYEETPKGRRKNYCPYCKKLMTNFTRHLQRRHPKEGRVKSWMDSIKNVSHSVRRSHTTRLVKEFNALYNAELLKRKNIGEATEAEYILSKAPKCLEERKLVRCTGCKGFYQRYNFYKHKKVCNVLAPGETVQGVPQIPEVEGMHEEFLSLLSGIQNDEVGLIVKSDPLILIFGVIFHKSRRHASEKNYVRRQLRTLGILVQRMRAKSNDITGLESCLTPRHFKTLVSCIEDWGKVDKTTGTVGVASVAYRVLTSIKECSGILIQKRIEDQYAGLGGAESVREVEDFEKLVKRGWSSLLGKAATKSMKSGKTLTTSKMPLEDDIYKMCQFITSQYDALIKRLERSENPYNSYNKLLDFLMSHILCLCRRRPVDLAKATLEHYSRLDTGDDLIKQVLSRPGQLLSSEDLANCKYFKTFYCPGKNNESVPVVLTPQMKNVLDTLIKHRSSCGITSKTLFIKAKNVQAYAGRSLEVVKKLVKLKKPKDFTSVGLRHHAATFSKLHSDNPRYQDFLASAMGHTLFMHKKKYDLPVSVLHKVFVAPTLHRMTINRPQEVQSMQRQDTSEQSVPAGPSSPPADASPLSVASPAPFVFPPSSPVVSPAPADVSPAPSAVSPAIAVVSPAPAVASPPSALPADNVAPLEPTSSVQEEGTRTTRLRWSTKEKRPIFRAFGEHLLKRVKIPRAKIVDFYYDNKKIYKRRTLQQVITFVNNLLLRKQKNVTPDINRFKLSAGARTMETTESEDST